MKGSEHLELMQVFETDQVFTFLSQRQQQNLIAD